MKQLKKIAILSIFVGFLSHAEESTVEDSSTLNNIKDNIHSYFADEAFACKKIEGVETDATEEINALAEKIQNFSRKAVGATFNRETKTFVDTAPEKLRELENEGTLLEYQIRGKVGNRWYREAPFYGRTEEMIEVQTIWNCSQQIIRSLALVAPLKVQHESAGKVGDNETFSIVDPKTGKTIAGLRTSATRRAALAVDLWFGEADITEILAVGSDDRTELVASYFKDTWFAGVLRALRYRKANKGWGLAWYERHLGWATHEYQAGVGFVDENGDTPFAEHAPLAENYLERANQLLDLGKEYLEAQDKAETKAKVEVE